MTIRCVDRPNRRFPRRFDAPAAARAYCTALRGGATEREIDDLIEQKCPNEHRKRLRGSAANEAALLAAFQQAETALAGSNAVFDGQIEVLSLTLRILGVLALIGRFIRAIPHPAARVVGGSAVLLRQVAQQRMTQITAQKAANDAALTILRREAANASQFRQVSGL